MKKNILSIILILLFHIGVKGSPLLEATDNTNTFSGYSLSLNGQTLTVNCNNISGYTVRVTDEEGYIILVINSSGTSCSFSIPTGNFYIYLSKDNYTTRVIFVNVTDSYIQNKVFNNYIDNYYIKNSTISAGYNVTGAAPYGIVSVESGNRLIINQSNNVFIKNGFECKIGGEFEIK